MPKPTERTIRQYHALRTLERDQTGKPEGKTAGKVAAKLLAKHPELARTRPKTEPAAATGGYSFVDLMRKVAEEFGFDELDKIINEVEKDFPGLLDNVTKQARRAD